MKASASKNLGMCRLSFTNERFCESLLLKLCLLIFCPLSKPDVHITWFISLLLIFNKLFSFIATWSFFLNLIYVPAMSLWLLILSFSFFYLNLCFFFYLPLLNNRFSVRKSSLIYKEIFSFEKIEKFQKIQVSSFLFKTFHKMECYWYSYDTWKSLAIVSIKKMFFE